MRVTVNSAVIRDLGRRNVLAHAMDAAAAAIEENVREEAESFAATRYFARSIYREIAAGSKPARVVSSDPFAHIIEYGSVNNPAYAPFRGALTGRGVRWTEGGGDA